MKVKQPKDSVSQNSDEQSQIEVQTSVKLTIGVQQASIMLLLAILGFFGYRIKQASNHQILYFHPILGLHPAPVFQNPSLQDLQQATRVQPSGNVAGALVLILTRVHMFGSMVSQNSDSPVNQSQTSRIYAVMPNQMLDIMVIHPRGCLN